MYADRACHQWPHAGGFVNYRALAAALAPAYGLGDWFHIPDEVTGFSYKVGPRPWVLRETFDPQRSRHRLLPRSTKPYGGALHPAHPQSAPHGPCRINVAGRLQLRYPTTLATRELTEDRHICREPDIRALRELLA